MYNKKKYDRSSLYAIHGTHDDVINIALAKKSYSELIDNGSLKYFEFSMAHEVIEKEIFLINGGITIHYYNHDRIKEKLKGLSPVQYRIQSLVVT